jgi:hypothetical protein
MQRLLSREWRFVRDLGGLDIDIVLKHRKPYGVQIICSARRQFSLYHSTQ